MNRFNKFLVTAFMSASLLVPNMVQATEIRELDHMSGDDQIRFVDKLIDSVEDASKSDPALLARVKRFFMNKQPGEVIDGMGRFELNLSLARIADMDSAAKNPKARRLEVEDVMYTTLERSGIILGNTFRPSASNFHPQQPLSDKYLTREDADKALAQTQEWIARSVEPEHTFSHGGPETGLSGFSNNEKAIAFFMALATVAAIANRSGGSSDSTSSGGYNDPHEADPWWVKSGYPSYHDAVKGACIMSRSDTSGC